MRSQGVLLPLQVALIVIMAHIGCFVPASFASIRCGVDRTNSQ